MRAGRSGVVVVVLAAACGGDDAQVDDGASSSESSSVGTTIDPTLTGPDTSASTTTSSSSSADESGTSSSGGSESTDDTTTGAVPTGHARFVVRERIAGSDFVDPVIREYADGVLSEPVALVPALPAGGGVNLLDVELGPQALTYCVYDPAVEGRECFAHDVAVDPIGPVQPFAGGALPATPQAFIPQWYDAAGSYIFRTSDAPEGGNPQIVRVAFEDGTLGVPEALVDPEDGIYLDFNGLHVSSDGTLLAYPGGVLDGAMNVFVVALDAGAPAPQVAATDITDPMAEASGDRFLQSSALIYAMDTVLGVGADAYYLLDLAQPVTPGVRIDDPADEALDVARLTVAPDDHALVYWVGEGLGGDVMFVELDGLAPQLPTPLSPAGAADVRPADIAWSPDSRWVVYTAEHEQPDTSDLYLADASGATPSAPVVVTDLVPGGGITTVLFDAASHWLYFVAPQESESAEIFRVDVSGAEPGAPQRVNAPLSNAGWASGELQFSPDGTQLLYTALDDEDLLRLWLVDVSGDEPGTAVRLDAPTNPLHDVSFGAKFSLDGGLVTFVERGPDPEGPRAVRLVDLSAPQTIVEVSADANNVVFLPE